MIEVLSQPYSESSWILPGPAQLELGGASLQASEGAPRLEVILLEEQGSDVRVGVRLDHARFAMWMSRARLLGIVTRDSRVAAGSWSTEATLRTGAIVHKLARKDGRTHVRYIGALELEGWIDDGALADRARTGGRRFGRVPSGKKPLMLTQGAVIRAEAKWVGAQLAVVNQGYLVDTIKAVDDRWYEVMYEDSDVRVHGFVSKYDPPGRTHRAKPPEPMAPIAPNVTVRDGTCLYVGEEPLGFIVGDRPVLVEKTGRTGWYTITIETPWGPIAFDAKGSLESELATCGG